MPLRRHLPLVSIAVLATVLSSCSSHRTRPVAAPSPSAVPPSPSPSDSPSPAPAADSPAPTGQPTCRSAALTLTDADAVVDATTWSEVYTVRTTGSPCQLHGWPVVQLLDRHGAAVGATYRHGGSPGTVTLSRGTSLSFTLTTARSGTCADAARIEASLPGTTAPLSAATTLSVCNRIVTVSPVLRRGDQEQPTS